MFWLRLPPAAERALHGATPEPQFQPGAGLDRIEIAIDVPEVTASDLLLAAPSEGSAEVAIRVAAARRL
jgi:hypothetical protein